MDQKNINKRLILGVFFLTLTGLSVTPTLACTIFTVSSGDIVFFGNNEDYTNPNTYLWLTNVNDSNFQKYGAVYVAIDYGGGLSVQGGMNSAGLAFDANGVPERPLNPHPELPSPRAWIPLMMLQECATVTEAINLAKNYNWGIRSMNYQIHVADTTGDAQ